jgi:two-component system phosphate regulon sensor histidine kinase PhoR
MKKRLFIYTTLIILMGFFGIFGVTLYVANMNNLNMVKTTVVEKTRIAAGLFTADTDMDEFVSVGGDTRITVISSEGVVLADSRPAEVAPIESHLLRPEVVAAAVGFPEVEVRHSETHGVDFIYYALRVDLDDTFVFIRTAIPVERIDEYLAQSLPMLFILLFILAVATFFMVRGIVDRVLLPFDAIESKLRLLSEGGEYSNVRIAGSDEESDKITKEIDDVANLLQKNYNELRDEKNKLSYILNSISDGIFVSDKNELLALVNTSAREMFNISADVAGKKINYMVSDKTLMNAISECTSHSKNTIFEYQYHGKIYMTTIKRLPGTDLTMVALADITEARENAKRREEFFANASHELKTPLTSIKGFTELAGLNNKDEGLVKYIEGITRETKRLMSLIGDMLKLSELENMQEINDPVAVSLSAVVNEVKDSITTMIAEKEIIFEATGNAEILAEPEHIFETLKNLIENAVRYNNQKGKVTVTIAQLSKNARLTVSDTGIGISPEEQTKIFERFYRVEKSRSAESGGTGLGLAIIKHTCALYGWKLSLKSKLGIGTDITIDFQHI